MPPKDWIIEREDARILVHRETKAGAVTAFAVVLLAWRDGDWHCATRYDCAHGFAHRDVLGFKCGLREKIPCASMTMKEAFAHALHDIQAHAPEYIRDFFAH